MGFFDFLKTGKRDKFDIKKPLTEPITNQPFLDTSLPDNSFQHDLGVPRTPSIESEPRPLSEKEAKYRMPEFQEQQDFRGSSGNSSSYSSPSSSSQYSSGAVSLEKDIQIISSKLDYLKAMLENMNHRLEALERIAKGEEEEVKW